MRISFCIIFTFLFGYATYCQTSAVNRQQFFLDDRVIETTLTTDIKKLRSDKKVPAWQPANVVMRFSDTAIISEEIRMEPRGSFRKTNCDLASLMLNFKNPTSPKLSHLKKLKLVGGCHSNLTDEELLLKEFLVYKIYNFITNMSFRIRLLHITYKDSRDKMRAYTQYAFLIEDMNDLCERNNCVEVKKKTFSTSTTNRQQTTIASMFEYMVGNTDWAVNNYHNIKLLAPKTDTLAPPYIVAYDFDYTGVVDAKYAVPDEQLGTTSVTERVYRGPQRNLVELQLAADIFNEKKERIMYYINNFSLLGAKTKRTIVDYLDKFYDIINSKSMLRNL